MMKKLIVILLSMMTYCLCHSQHISIVGKEDEEKYESARKNIINNINKITDIRSINIDLDKCPFIYYETGHYDRIWSLIYKKSSKIVILYGGSSTQPHQLKGPILKKLLSSNQNTINWGLDSCNKFLPDLVVVEKEYSTLGNCLIISNKDFISKMTLYGSPYFQEQGENIIEEKISSLIYLMLWIAFPEWREIIYFPKDKH